MGKLAKIDVIIDSAEAKQRFSELQTDLIKIKTLRDQAFSNGEIGAFKVYDKELKDVGKEMRQFKTSAIDVEDVLKRINKVSKNDLKEAYSEARKELDGLARDSDKYAGKKANFEKLAGEMDKVNGSLKSQTSWLSKAGASFNQYFGVVAAGIAGLTGVFLSLKDSIKVANDYQSTVASLSALTGLKGDELDWISNKAKEMSTMTLESGIIITNSADIIVDAFKKMGSARPDLLGNKEALAAVTKEALILSEAAELDLDSSINAVAAALNSFDMEATESTRIINVFAAASLAGNVEVVDLTASMKNVGAVAKDSNMSLENSVALLEILGKSDIKGEQAGTKLRGAMLKLKEAGLGYTSGLFVMRDALVEANQMLEKHTGAKEKDALKLKIFGAENVTVGTILTQNIDKYDELTKAVTGTNVAYDQAKTNTDTNNAILDQQRNKIKLITIDLGEKLAPVMSSSLGIFTKFMQVLITSINFYAKHSYAINSTVAVLLTYIAVSKLQAFWTAINTKVEIEGIATTKLKLVQQKLTIIWSNIQLAVTQLLSAAQMLLTGNTKGAAQAMRVFNSVIKANPLGFYLAAILAVGAAIYYFAKQTGKLTEEQKKAALHSKLNSEVEQKAVDLYGEKAAKLEYLKRIVNDSTKSEKERKKALEEINQVTNGVVNVTDLNTASLSRLNSELNIYQTNLRNTAKAEAAKQLMLEKEKEIANIRSKDLEEFAPTVTQVYSEREVHGIFQKEEKAKQKYKLASDNRKKLIADKEKEIEILMNEYSAKIYENETKNDALREKNKTPIDKDKKAKKAKEWSLNEDKDFIRERLALQQERIDGTIASEEELQQQIQQMEIFYLQRRIAQGTDSEAKRLQLQQELNDKLITQKSNAEKRTLEAQKKHIEEVQKQNQKATEDLKLQQNEEFASITTLGQAKAILKDSLSKEELDKLTNLYDAKQAVRKHYDKQEQQLAITQTEALLHIYEKIAKDGAIGGIGALSPDQQKELQDKIDKLKQQFAELKAAANVGDKDEKPKKDKKELKSAKVDIFGFSQDDWEILFDNLSKGKFGVEEMTMVANSMIDIWKSYSDIMAKTEQKELNTYIKNQDKKKKTLSKTLEQGRVSQESYNAQVEAMDAEVERKKAVADRNAAKRERDIALMSAIVNTSSAMVSSLKTDPTGIMALLIGVMGGIQIKKIMATPLPEMPGAEAGGNLMDVLRSQDGKRFSAKNQPNKRGFVNSPTIITGENGTEYILPKEALENPSIRNFIDFVEQARQSGSLSSINLPMVRNVAGRESGGYASSSRGQNTSISNQTSVYNQQSADLNQIAEVMKKLSDQLDKGITAKTYLRGSQGIYEAMKEDDQLKKNAKF